MAGMMKETRPDNPEIIRLRKKLAATKKSLGAANELLEKSLNEAVTARDFAENIIETVVVPLLVLDHELRTLKVNKSFYHTFKVSATQTLYKHIYELGNRQWDIPELRRLLGKTLHENTSFENFEIRHDFPNIGYKIMLLNARQIKTSQPHHRFILLGIEDITERKHIGRLADIGALSSTIAHELRNPLGVIRSAIYNIKQKTPGQVSLKSHIANIEKKVTESDAIINDLLMYARIKEPRCEDIAIFDFLNENIENFKTRYPYDHLLVKMKCGCESNEVLQADRAQMDELMDNILHNAYQALDGDKGKIIIAVECEKKENKFNLTVKDNGIGIDKKDLVRVFEPFFTTKTKGVGLGLTVCKQIVDLHGGAIEIKSKKGEGTEVYLSVPLKR